MRIIQITDMHISREGENPHGIDVRNQFLQVFLASADFNPDCVVLSGDLCFGDPSHEIYEWIAEQIRIFSCPVFVIAGNHDTQSVMHRHFTCDYHPETDEIYCAQEWQGKPILFLDSARGVMSDIQYRWLEGFLSTSGDQVFIFMHHPPAYCGVPHMDMTYAFREIPRLQRLLIRSKAEFQIFCGHYHVERELSFANQQIYITPSTFFQIDATQVEFKIAHSKPGYRVIDLDEDGLVHSACHYL